MAMGKPKIRFKGYEDDWEQRKFADMAIRESAVQTASQEIPGVEYDDVVVEEGCLNKDISSKETKKSGILFDGSQVLYGKLRPYLHNWLNPDFKGVAVGDWWVLKPIDLNKNFLYRLIQTQQFDNIANQSAGSKMPRADWNLISNSAFMVPFPNEEQRKIGDYFLSLDHLITLHQRKCEETKSLKKYMLQKMFPENGKCVPEIRFSGFSDDWEQRKLGDVLVSLQNNTLSRADLSKETGVAKNVHYGDVLIKYGEVLDVSKAKLPMISDESILTKYRTSFLQNGDVIVADTAEDSTVGKCSEIAGLIDEVVLSGLHTIPYRPVEKFASGYLGYYLNSNAYHHQLIPLMQGIKVTSISKSAMQDTGIIYPKLIEEQAKIGTYFQSLDHLITLHQRKCYRFIDIALDAWEQRKLGDNIIEYHEVTTENNQYPVLTSSRKGIFLQTEYYSGNQVASSDNTGYNVVPYGYFTYRHMSDDQIFYFNINDIVENGIVSTLYPVFTTNIKIDSRYLQYQLNYGREFAKFAILQKQGGSRTYMYLNKLKSLCLTMPKTIGEQKKISEYFMKLDHLITLHQHKCDELQKLKKFMLQNMFM